MIGALTAGVSELGKQMPERVVFEDTKTRATGSTYRLIDPRDTRNGRDKGRRLPEPLFENQR